MRAVIWDGNRLLLSDDHPRPRSASGMATVKVHLAGICSTDLQILKGYMDFRGVPGHEFVGEVADGPHHLVGKRVVGEINFACGQCQTCDRGLARHCPRRSVMGILGADGSYAEYVAVPTDNLYLVPDGVSDTEAVFTEPLAAAFEILDQVPVTPTTDVIVFGDGKLGLLCAQVLRSAGARVTVVGRHARKIALLLGQGIRAFVLADWGPSQADVVVEATGSAAGLKLAVASVRPRGTLVLKSTVAEEHTLSLAPLVINEITVVGSRCGPFSPALKALQDRAIDVTAMVDQVYPLSQAPDALAHASRPGALKVLLKND